MNVLLLYVHPEPKSFTHALLEVAKKTIVGTGNTFEVSDLYGEKFNPVGGRHDFLTVDRGDIFLYQKEQALAAEKHAYAPDIAREQDRVRRADMIVFLFPIWWGFPPAMMKGWFDRVLSYGFAYVDGTRFETGLFHGKSSLVCAVTGGTAKRFSEGGTYGSIQQVLWPIEHCGIEYLGMTRLDPFVAYAAPRVNAEERQQYLVAWSDHLRRVLPSARRL